MLHVKNRRVNNLTDEKVVDDSSGTTGDPMTGDVYNNNNTSSTHTLFLHNHKYKNLYVKPYLFHFSHIPDNFKTILKFSFFYHLQKVKITLYNYYLVVEIYCRLLFYFVFYFI